MRPRKNGIDPRHIVRDVTEDLFNESLLGHVKWLSMPKNREWAQGVAIRALGSSAKTAYQPPTIQSKRGATVVFSRYKDAPHSGIFVIEGGSRPAVRGESQQWNTTIENPTDLRDAKMLARAILPPPRLNRKTSGGEAPTGAHRDVIDAVAALIVDISTNGLPEVQNE
jgi:hypothetical protein